VQTLKHLGLVESRGPLTGVCLQLGDGEHPPIVEELGAGFTTSGYVLDTLHDFFLVRCVGITENKMLKRVIIFDWDDTLLPSTHLKGKPLYPLTEVTKVLRELLLLATQLGVVYIMTGAHLDWISHCRYLAIPGCDDILSQIPIISVRSDEPYHTWKYRGLLELPWDHVEELISVGDCYFDIEAAQTIGKQLNIRTKTVQLLNRPTILQHIQQLELLLRELTMIVDTPLNLVLCTNCLE
jgi:hypothetical protein